MSKILIEGHEAELAIKVAPVECPLAHRMKPHPLYNLTGLRRIGDMWHNDARRIGLKGADVITITATADPHERVDIMDTSGADLVFKVEPVVGHMFIAQPDRIYAAERSDFDGTRICEIEFEDRRQLAGGKEF